MVLVIESLDPDIIQALSEVAKALKVTFRVESEGVLPFNQQDRQRRIKILRKFKGGLNKHYTGYQPNKYDWYQQ